MLLLALLDLAAFIRFRWWWYLSAALLAKDELFCAELLGCSTTPTITIASGHIVSWHGGCLSLSGNWLMRLWHCRMLLTQLQLLACCQCFILNSVRPRLCRTQLVSRVGKAAALPVLATTRLNKATHFLFEKPMCCTELFLIMGKATGWVVAAAHLSNRLAHTCSSQIWLLPHLICGVGIWTLVSILTMAVHEEFTHVSLEKLQRMFFSRSGRAAAPCHGCARARWGSSPL